MVIRILSEADNFTKFCAILPYIKDVRFLKWVFQLSILNYYCVIKVTQRLLPATLGLLVIFCIIFLVLIGNFMLTERDSVLLCNYGDLYGVFPYPLSTKHNVWVEVDGLRSWAIILCSFYENSNMLIVLNTQTFHCRTANM